MVKLRKNLWFWGGLIPALTVAIDQASKYWAIRQFRVPYNICAINPHPNLGIEISPVFDLALVCNQGISFGLFNSNPDLSRIIFTAVAAIMCVLMLLWLNKEKGKLISLSIGLIIGGAIGNGIDRFLNGAVTDFLNFSDIKFIWVFNIADSAITCGVIGLLIHMFFIEGKNKKSVKSP